jgi:hypothetical protein
MISDIIERFRYRFQLWRREQREDYFTSSAAPPLEEDYVSYYVDRDRVVMLKESTIRPIGRTIQAYFGIIIIVAWIGVLVGRHIPSARFGVGVGFLAFAVLWTFAMITATIRLTKARKQYREQQPVKSSNHAMERTADRGTPHI